MPAQLSSSSAPPVRLNSAVAAMVSFLIAGTYEVLNNPMVHAAAHSVQVSMVRPRPLIGSHVRPVSSFRPSVGMTAFAGLVRSCTNGPMKMLPALCPATCTS